MKLLYLGVIFWGCLILYEFLSVCNNLLKSNREKKEPTISFEDEMVNFRILISVFNEKDKIVNTLKYFQKMEYAKKEIILITTSKELLNVEYEESACRLAKMLAESNKNVRCIQSPYCDGNKATQLNYAISILNSEKCEKNDFVIIYDIDSRPELHTLKEINHLYLRDNKIRVFQQSSLYIANYNALKLWFKVEALMQIRRSIGIEIPNYKYTRTYNGNPYLMPYCVGHGLAVQLGFLVQNKGFPEPYEDIAFGARMILQKEYICPVETAYDYAEVVNNLKHYFRQLGVWYQASCAGTLEIIRNPCKASKKIVPMLWSVLDVLSWSYYFIFVLLVILAGGLWRIGGMLFVILISLANAGVALRCFGNQLQKHNIIVNDKEHIAFMLCYLMRELFRGIAPISAFLQIIRKRIKV